MAAMRLDTGPGTTALEASGTSVGRRWVLTGAHIHGEVRACAIQVASRIWLKGARIENPGGMALCLAPIDVTFDIVCEQMTAVGGIDLTGAKIGGHLNLRRTRLINPPSCGSAG
jgi:hypothetical protein